MHGARIHIPVAGSRCLRGGYTILEICLVLFIISLIAAASIPLISSIVAEQQIREPMRQIELLARTARHLATAQQRTYVLVINTDSIHLLTQAQQQGQSDTSSSDTTTTSSTATSSETTSSSDDTDQPSAMTPVEQEYTIPEGVALTVRGWQEKEWYVPVDRVWVFPPTGLCEPLEIHAQKGEAYIEQVYDPLTCAIKDEKYSFP